MATVHFDKRISRFRCDNRRKYLTNEIKDFKIILRRKEFKGNVQLDTHRSKMV